MKLSRIFTVDVETLLPRCWFREKYCFHNCIELRSRSRWTGRTTKLTGGNASRLQPLPSNALHLNHMHHCIRYVSGLDTGHWCKNRKETKLKSKPEYNLWLTNPHYKSCSSAYFALFYKWTSEQVIQIRPDIYCPAQQTSALAG